MNDSYWQVRRLDLNRHLSDLENNSYEGAADRAGRVEVFRTAFSLVTPVAVAVLEDLNRTVLGGGAEVTTLEVAEHPTLGQVGRWELSWPEQRAARNRFDSRPLAALAMNAFFPEEFTHGHLGVLRGEELDQPSTAWPLQVTSAEEASRYRPILEVVSETELHELIFLSSWRVIPPHGHN